MVRQERALRTRRLILEAAASVFDEFGYEGATIGEVVSRAGVTRGAVYFHFASKRELAQGVVDEQFAEDGVPERACKLQELVDTGMVLAHLLPRDPLLSAAARLSLGQDAFDEYGGGGILGWISRFETILVAAGERGELLPHVTAADAAWLLTAAWTGVQIQSQKLSGRADLESRVAGLFRHVMPSIAVPGVLGALRMGPDRGARVVAEVAAARAAAEGGAEVEAHAAGGAAPLS
ncbi:ScbR family autoregulator-binding transcription factor [Streptomyces sp. SP17BM10]|uniref:ScbR family autoregulator-binding transcription factor n=1 Tax=Streptomyces sp. SP17BM10 TaxID=3002530 RepID=UPI002E793A7A|nr:ScbR family autoregulator-binding transcription factor [Streptomyces sp. SP17BM10]MEE1782649.1 ScbR family autoregulator-binding transcription factor [Streptomyces sp. SP17BM10]